MGYLPDPFPLDRKPGTRRVYFSGHQMCWSGWFHAWTRDDDGKLLAVIEHQDGSIRWERQTYCLAFVDLEPTR